MGFTLTADQKQQYRDQGFLILRASEHQLLSRPSLLQEWSNEVMNWPLEKGKWMPYYEDNDRGDKQIMRTEKFMDYHDEFERLLCGDDLRGLLHQCSGEVSRVYPPMHPDFKNRPDIFAL